jgi:hypothetical protein
MEINVFFHIYITKLKIGFRNFLGIWNLVLGDYFRMLGIGIRWSQNAQRDRA